MNIIFTCITIIENEIWQLIGHFPIQILPQRSNGVMFNHDSNLIPVKLAVQLYQSYSSSFYDAILWL